MQQHKLKETNTCNCWNTLLLQWRTPFYLAIGHSNKLLLFYFFFKDAIYRRNGFCSLQIDACTRTQLLLEIVGIDYGVSCSRRSGNSELLLLLYFFFFSTNTNHTREKIHEFYDGSDALLFYHFFCLRSYNLTFNLVVSSTFV